MNKQSELFEGYRPLITHRRRGARRNQTPGLVKASIDAFRPGDMSSRQLTYHIKRGKQGTYKPTYRRVGNSEGEL
jgi:hypothetical protein